MPVTSRYVTLPTTLIHAARGQQIYPTRKSAMSESLYVSCAQVLSVCQGKKDDLAALLDPETGYAPSMRQVCHDQ